MHPQKVAPLSPAADMGVRRIKQETMKNIAITFLLLFSHFCYGGNSTGSDEWNGWISRDGKPLKNTESQKADKGFGSILVLENDPNFFKKWNTPSETFKYETLKKIKKGEYFIIAIIFINPGVDSNGNTNITFDVKIKNPDGTVYADIPNLNVWNRKSPKKNTLGLSEGYLKIKMEPEDYIGEYKVEAVVNDKIKQVRLALSSKYEVEK